MLANGDWSREMIALQSAALNRLEQRDRFDTPAREHAAPLLLTARPFLRAHANYALALGTAQFDIRTVEAWFALPDACERIRPDVVIVDLDAQRLGTAGRHAISGHRLVQMLARSAAALPCALVVVTRLDFVEIEDLARLGVTAIISPHESARSFLTQIRAACRKARQSIPAGGEQAPVDASVHALASHLWSSLAPALARVFPDSRVRIPDHQIVEALAYILLTGAPWTRLPRSFGSAATMQRRLRRWQAEGLFAESLMTGMARHHWPGLHWERLPGTRPASNARETRRGHLVVMR